VIRRGVWSAVVLAALLTSCRYEDRGYASCVAAHALTLEMRSRLACAAAHGPGFPGSLESVLDASLDRTCGVRSEHLSAFAQYATREGTAVAWHKHRWTYSLSVPATPETFRHFTLAAVDERPEKRYISYWVDDSGVLRSARGRRAGASDKAEEWQALGPS
jgi:hypothetical protein